MFSEVKNAYRTNGLLVVLRPVSLKFSISAKSAILPKITKKVRKSRNSAIFSEIPYFCAPSRKPFINATFWSPFWGSFSLKRENNEISGNLVIFALFRAEYRPGVLQMIFYDVSSIFQNLCAIFYNSIMKFS